MVQVRGYSEDDVEVLAAELADIIVESMRTATKRTAEQLTPALVAADSVSLGPTDVAVLSEYWAEEVDGVLTPYVGQVYTGSAATVAVGLADGFPLDDNPGIPLVPDEYTLTFLQTVKGDFVGVGDDVWEDVRDVLVTGVKNGESIEQISAKIAAIPEFTQRRATEVARTVTHAASESGSIGQLRFLGYGDEEVEKEWLCTHDARTRPNHLAADKQKRRISERFNVGATTLDFPGDPSGAWSETRQCRCTVLFNVDEAPKMRCGSVIPATSPGGLPLAKAGPKAKGGKSPVPAGPKAKGGKSPVSQGPPAQPGPPALSAAATATMSSTSTHCVYPTASGEIDISHIPEWLRDSIFKAFAAYKITPGWGGAKIHKVAQAVKSDLGLTADISEWHILAVVDEAKTGPKFLPKFKEWLDGPGKKVADVDLPPNVTGIVVPIEQTTSVVPAPAVIPKLPPVAAKPSPGEIQFTGVTLGSHGAEVWRNPVTGERWLFKPQKKYATDLDVGIAKIQSKAVDTRPGMYEVTLNGDSGSLQYMFDSVEAFPNGSFDPLKLSADDILILQEGQIFDWLISNFDTHSGQWIRLSDGRLFGTDKGQAFKFFGQDKLDWDYIPVTPLGQDKLTYQAMWKAYVQGKSIDMQDPTSGALGAYIDRLMAIPDDEIRKLLMAYAQAKGTPTPEEFLDAVIKRKHALKKDFSAFWERAVKERAKHVTPTMPAVPKLPPPPELPPIPVVPTVVAPSPGAAGDVSAISHVTKEFIWDTWGAISGGKTVTPGWGGSKIYKQLLILLGDVNSGGGVMINGQLTPLDALQLIRILDEIGGFKGKPKTYESVLLEWLSSAAGKKAAPNPPSSLVKSGVTPVTKPSAVDEAAELMTTGQQTTPLEIWPTLVKYKNGDVVGYGYAMNAVGDITTTYRLTRVATGVKIESRSTGGTKWIDAGEAKSPGALKEYQKYGTSFWWVEKPPSSTVASKIPGKVPGDEVSLLEIGVSRFLWGDGEIVATDTDKFGGTYRMISDGVGGFAIKYVTKDNKLLTVKIITPSDKMPSKIPGVSGVKWKLSSSAVTSPVKGKPSILIDVNAGDVVTWEQIKAGTPGALSDPFQLAYAYWDVVQSEYRLWYMPDGTYKIQRRLIGTKLWKDIAVEGDSNFDNTVTFFTWHAATKNGGEPDAYKLLVPGKSGTPAGTKKPANVTGYMEGDTVAKPDLMHAQAQPGSVLATHVDATGVTWRLIVDGEGDKVIEFSQNGQWKYVSKIKTVTELDQLGPSAYAQWTAASTKAPVPKSLIPGFPGKDPGDEVTWAEVVGAIPKYKENEVVALASYSGGQYRFVATGHGGLNTEIWSDVKKTWVPTHTEPANYQLKNWHFTTVEPHTSTGVKKVLLMGSHTHVPGKTVGDSVSIDEIVQYHGLYVDGQIIAFRPATYGVGAHRIFVAHGKIIMQKQTKAGAWAGTKIIENAWSISPYNGWKLTNDVITPQHLKAAQKFVDKKTTVKYASVMPTKPGEAPVAQPALKFAPKVEKPYEPLPAPPEQAKFLKPIPKPKPPPDLIPPELDLSGFTDADKVIITDAFRLTKKTTSSSGEQLFDAMQQITKTLQTRGGKWRDLTLAHVIRFVDEARDARHGVTTPSYTYEKKILAWWTSSARSKTKTVQIYDAPVLSRDLPPVMHRLDAPQNPNPDTQRYRVLTDSEARAHQKDMEAKYGRLTSAQSQGTADYTGGHFREINHAVRDGTVAASGYRTHIHGLASGMRPSTVAIKLLRATGWSDFYDETITNFAALQAYVGRVFAWRRMVSTTIKASRTYSVKSEVIFHIEAPIGTPMVYAPSHGGISTEYEMILSPHTLFRIIKVEDRKGKTHVTVRVVGVADPNGGASP